MKKLFFTAVLAASFVALSAKDNVSVTPLEIEKGVSVAEDPATLEFYLEASRVYAGVGFHLFIPKGIIVEYNDDEEDPTSMTMDYALGNIAKSTKFSISIENCNSSSWAQAKPDHNAYLVNIYPKASANKFSSTLKGVLFTINVGSTADIEDGIYPVYIDYNFMAASATDENPEVASASYIKVGNPTKQTFTVLGEITPHVAESLEDETAISTLDISGCTGIPADGIKTSATVKYERTTSNQWGTVCLPYALTSTSAVQYYTTTEVNDSELHVKKVDEVAAGTPAIFKTTGSSISLQSSGAVAKAAAGTAGTPALMGTYEYIEKLSDCYFIANDYFWSTSDFEQDIELKAFRAYMPLASVEPMQIVVDEPEGITELEMDENGELREVYNLQGQHMSAPVKGQISIVNGKKVFNK